jgi:hypothetical protein
MGRLCRVTRTLFALGQVTLWDAAYSGPSFDLDRIAGEINDKVESAPLARFCSSC